MNTMKLTTAIADNFTLTSRDKNSPAVCVISDLDFCKNSPDIQFTIVWTDRGRYTNLQLKKLVARTMARIIRRAVKHAEILHNTHTEGE